LQGRSAKGERDLFLACVQEGYVLEGHNDEKGREEKKSQSRDLLRRKQGGNKGEKRGVSGKGGAR